MVSATASTGGVSKPSPVFNTSDNAEDDGRVWRVAIEHWASALLLFVVTMTGVILLILRANDVHGLAFALAVFGGVMGMVGGAVALHAVNRTRVELLRYALITHITCTGIHLAALAAALGIWTAEFQTADPYAETSTAPTTISRDMAEANMHAYERRLAAGVALPTVGAWFVVCAVVSGVAAVFVRERLVLLHGRRVDPRWRELFRVRK